MIDATPQEKSDSLFQLGPSSLVAVKKGEVGLGYDTAFVLAEVNADVMTFIKDDNSEWGFKKIDTDTTSVGG